MITPLVLSLISALLFNINSNWWHNQPASMALGIFYLFTLAWLASRLITFTTRRLEQIVWGSVFTLAGLSSTLGVIFYLYQFNSLIFTAITFIIPILLFSLGSIVKTAAPQIKSKSQLRSLAVLFFLSEIGLIYYLWLNQVDIAVRSPWQMLNITPLVLFGIMVVSFLMASPHSRSLWWLIGLSFGSVSLLLFIFPLPFGFDPWIHVASEKIIFETGTINPKPLYYLGQYLPVIFFSKLSTLPVGLVDRWLLPVLAAFGWSAALLLFIKNIKPQTNLIFLVAASVFAFSWPMFTITTPQNLSYFWALLSILLIATRLFNNKITWWPIIITALASVIAHPLTGFPLILLLTMFWLNERRSPVIKNLSWLAGLGALVVTPLAFIALSWLKISDTSVVIKNNFLPAFNTLGQKIWQSLPFPGKYIEILDWAYWWQSILIWMWFVLAIVGLTIVWNQYPKFKLFLISFAVMSASYVVMNAFLSFPNLPANEQLFYADRLWVLAQLWLWPLVLLGAHKLFTSWWSQGDSIKNIMLAGLTVSLIAAFYLNYPRLDLYHKDTGYNTTKSDIEAVNLIAQDAGEVPYVVLANQAVSAAALHEFGFAHYYSGELYYPLPTGTNPLYQVFLQAAETGVPTRAVISQAHNFSGTSFIYLVLNEYWADFDKLTAIAQTESSTQMEVNNGYIKIYRYDF